MYVIAIIGFMILGSIVASFVAVIAERIHTGQSWVSGRSRCNSCACVLSAIDLIPVVSWFVSGGRCRTCSARVPLSYALGELILGALFAGAYSVIGFQVALLPFLFALATLAFIVIYDLRHTVVPRTASTMLLMFAAAYAVLTYGTGKEFGATLLVAGAISLFFFLLHACSRGRAMGLGDAPVALALALLVGSSLGIAGLLFSFWIGAVVGIGILVRSPRGHRIGIEVPFVPFLAAGYLLVYFTQWNPLPLF